MYIKQFSKKLFNVTYIKHISGRTGLVTRPTRKKGSKMSGIKLMMFYLKDKYIIF